ncbi:TPA: DUF2845 domain-containing protein [Pseudomonas aeruginosa]|nr:DUF2845 domain-containing protein [Pseudomonas aeruginosa]EKU4832150.1 DUF2845 domain-containing protein [Pseudomonas aeruginosa]EKW2948463.1 DUF2845 domain-containing protein [Pseudomonas aeruginosa]MBH4337332.1 DUF2845 domain-containing protein [Pseudomonas aeruginosa]HCF2613239.1 DUF2845 domain-containing protein [Pseudomonas aeruginosa]
MKNLRPSVFISSLLLSLTSVSAQATMRCGSEIINEGNTTFEVVRKCGEPTNREIINPIAGNDSNKANNNAVPVENWVYGPDNGMYRYLRFVDGVLTQIRSQRN